MRIRPAALALLVVFTTGPATLGAQDLEEIQPVHNRHVPFEQDGLEIGMGTDAIQGFTPVFRFE